MSTFRKQFQRVRQNIDQNLGRAEKTEILTEEEQFLDKRIEQIRNMASVVYKRLLPCLRSQAFGSDTDKRIKKLPESVFSSALVDLSTHLESSSSNSSQFMKAVGDLQWKISQEVFNYDLTVENNTIKFLSNIIEVDYPAIQKLKKTLNSRTLDMDAAKSRHQSAQKQFQAGAVPSSKVDEARVELEDAVMKLEQAKDQWATEMYNFVSKELELNQALFELTKLQALMFKNSLEVVESYLPMLQDSLDFNKQKPVFGQELEEHVKMRNNRSIAKVIEECVQYLSENGVKEEGIFRITGAASRVKKLKAAFNFGNVELGPFEDDVHVIASTLKLYLRELPEPLLRNELFDEWISALRQENQAEALKNVSLKLPTVYYNNLKFLIRFFAVLSEHSDVTKMTASNLGLVLGPNLITPPDSTPEMTSLSVQSTLAEALIVHAHHIFPGDINFKRYSAEEPNQDNINRLPAHSTQPPTSKKPNTIIFPAMFSNNLADNLKSSDPDLLSSCSGTSTRHTPPNTSNTLRKTKKSPAPQPPTIRHSMAPSPHPTEKPQVAERSVPFTEKLEKPRHLPPERPNIPPPDKPPLLERPRMQPPPVPYNPVNNNNNNQTSDDCPYPYQPSSQPPAQRPIQPQAVYPDLSMSQSLYPYIPPETDHSPLTKTPSQSQLTSFKTHQRNHSYTDINNHDEGDGENNNEHNNDNNNMHSAPVASNDPALYNPKAAARINSLPRGHTRNSSLGKCNPPRPHPPLPPKKVELNRAPSN